MKQIKCLKNLRTKILNSKGFSYLEFSFMFVVLIGLIYIFVQLYGFINTQIKVSNAASNALRRVELAGAVVYQDPKSGNMIDVVEDARNDLADIANIDPSSIQILINDPDSGQMTQITNSSEASLRYQIRTPIRLKLSAKYNFVKLDTAFSASPLEGGITLTSSFQGASEKFFKDLNSDYQPFNAD